MNKIAATLLVLLATLLGPSKVRAEATLLAQVELAQQYEHGEGVAQDTVHAMALYCAAAEAGSADAAFRLGWIYLSGRGVDRDAAVAGRWLAGAASRGDAQAIAVMERFHLAADGVAAHCAKPGGEVQPEATRQIIAPAAVAAMVDDMAPKYGLDPKLVLAVIQVESAFHPDAVSPKNAQGLMQVIPATAERFGVLDPMQAKANLTAGMKYLRWLLSYFQGDVTLSLAAYNAGEKRVVAHRGIPPIPETQDYVRRIHAYYPAMSHPFDPRVSVQSGLPWPGIKAP